MGGRARGPPRGPKIVNSIQFSFQVATRTLYPAPSKDHGKKPKSGDRARPGGHKAKTYNDSPQSMSPRKFPQPNLILIAVSD